MRLHVPKCIILNMLYDDIIEPKTKPVNYMQYPFDLLAKNYAMTLVFA